MDILQISKGEKALHLSSSYLPAPAAKTSSYGPTQSSTAAQVARQQQGWRHAVQPSLGRPLSYLGAGVGAGLGAVGAISFVGIHCSSFTVAVHFTALISSGRQQQALAALAKCLHCVRTAWALRAYCARCVRTAWALRAYCARRG